MYYYNLFVFLFSSLPSNDFFCGNFLHNCNLKNKTQTFCYKSPIFLPTKKGKGIFWDNVLAHINIGFNYRENFHCISIKHVDLIKSKLIFLGC